MKVIVHPDGRIEVEGADPGNIAAVVSALRTAPASAPVAVPKAPDAPPPPPVVVREEPRPQAAPRRRYVPPGLPPPDTRPSVGPPVVAPVRPLIVPKYGAFCEFVVGLLKRGPQAAPGIKEAGRKAGLLIRDAELDSIAVDPESGVTKSRNGEFRYSSQPRTVAHYPALVQRFGERGSEWHTAGGAAVPYRGESKTIRRKK